MIGQGDEMGARIPEKLTEFIKKEAEKAEYFLLEVSSRGGSGLFLDITLDKQGGITLDECSNFNRMVSVWMEKSEICGSSYTVDVASPGLDRVLKSDADFEWASGKKITVTTYEPVDEKRHFEGKLLASGDSEITLEQGSGETVRLKRKNIAKAQLKVEI